MIQDVVVLEQHTGLNLVIVVFTYNALMENLILLAVQRIHTFLKTVNNVFQKMQLTAVKNMIVINLTKNIFIIQI